MLPVALSQPGQRQASKSAGQRERIIDGASWRPPVWGSLYSLRPNTVSAMARRSPTVRLIYGFIAAIAAAYILIVSALWYGQASFIFQPSPDVETTPADLGVKFEKVALPIGGGQVVGWWVPSQNPQAATLLYSHGNAGNIGANAQDV